MTEKGLPVTNAIRFLREKGVQFKVHLYHYEKEDITGTAARSLGVDEHMVIKTLVMRDDTGKPLVVLMHGDRQVSTRKLAKAIGAKNVTPSSPRDAQKCTGYMIGGISPFGTRKELRIYVEKSIFDLSRLYINGGRRGLLVEMTPSDLVKCLNATAVNVAT
jgi:Cys-tRNA(Pro) deacylase